MVPRNHRSSDSRQQPTGPTRPVPPAAVALPAEAASEELRRLLAITDTALAHLQLEDLLRALLDRICMVMDVKDAAILLLDGDSQQLTLRAARGLEDAVVAGATIPVGQGFAGRIAASRAPLIVDDLSTFAVVYPQLRETQRSAVGVPLQVEDRLLGVVYVGSATPRRFTEADVQLLQRAADRIALAIDRAQLFEAEQAARREAEAALAQAQVSESRYQRLVEANVIGVVVGDAERAIEANDAYLRLLGYTRDDLLAGRLTRLAVTPPEYLAATEQVMQEALTTGACEPIEKEYLRKDGSRVPALAGMALLERDPVRFVSFVLDLTERKRLEQEREAARTEAEQQAEQLDRVFEQMADGVAVYDAQGRIVRENAAQQRLLGLDVAAPADYAELPLAERIALFAARDEQGRLLGPEEGPLPRVLHGEVMSGAEAMDIRSRTLDGREVDLSISAAPLRDRAGHLTGAVCIFRDQTERKQLERALQASEARYRDLVELQTDLICRYLPDTTLTFVNVAFCRSYGRPREELLGRRFLDLLDESVRAHHVQYIAALLAHPHTSVDEHEDVLPDGSTSWQQWVDHPIFDAEGHLVEIQSVGRDTTERRRAEEALRESEARFRAAFESAATGMLLVDIAGHPLQVNRPLVEMLGYSEEELRTHTFMDLTYPDDLEANLALFRQALAGEIDSYHLEKRYRHKQGHLVWAFLSTGVVRDAAGQPLYFVGQVQDITERKRAEEALRSSEERFRTMADTAPVLIWVSDTDGLVTFVNAPWLRFTGRSPEQELGNGWAEGVHPDDSQRCLETYLTAFQARQRFTMEYRLRRFDGEYRWIVDTGVPRFAPDGSFLGYIGSAIDISDHKQLEQEREEARAEAERQAAQLEATFEAIADGVAVYDAHGRVLRENAAQRRLLGLDAAPPGYAELPLPERMALFAGRDKQGRLLGLDEGPLPRLKRGEVLSGSEAIDVWSRTLDGREVELSVSAAPLRDREGRLTGAVCIFRDQTERNRMEREREAARASQLALLEVNRHMEQFLVTASHDLRTPVTGVVMGVELAQRRLQQVVATVPPVPPVPPVPAPLPPLTGDRPADQQDAIRAALNALERASGAAQRLSRLIVRLFDVAQARTGTLDLKLAACDLAALVHAEVAAQRALAPERTIRLDLDAGMPVPVVADGDRLGQVLANYLTNALKYAPADQPVVVTLAVQAGQAQVAVRDEGPGLPPEEQPRVWELFHRAPGVPAQGSWGGSMGIGLYICKQIVERHGGQVGVESVVGAGSTFWFTLPLATAEAGNETSATATS